MHLTHIFQCVRKREKKKKCIKSKEYDPRIHSVTWIRPKSFKLHCFVQKMFELKSRQLFSIFLLLIVAFYCSAGTAKESKGDKKASKASKANKADKVEQSSIGPNSKILVHLALYFIF